MMYCKLSTKICCVVKISINLLCWEISIEIYFFWEILTKIHFILSKTSCEKDEEIFLFVICQETVI